jgi:hypothetical protein
MTRRRAYYRLALVAAALLALGLALTRDFVTGGVMAAAVLVSGALAIELGSRRRRGPPRGDDE